MYRIVTAGAHNINNHYQLLRYYYCCGVLSGVDAPVLSKQWQKESNSSPYSYIIPTNTKIVAGVVVGVAGNSGNNICAKYFIKI